MFAETIRRGEGYNAWGVITFVGLSHDYPQFSTWLDDNLKPEFAEEFWSAETLSIQGITDKFIPIPTCDYFIRGCDAWDDEIVVSIMRNSSKSSLNFSESSRLTLRSNERAHRYSEGPLVFVLGKIVSPSEPQLNTNDDFQTANDEISPIQQTRDLYNKHCQNGADILVCHLLNSVSVGHL